MPFQSEKQRRFLHANHPEIAKRWEKEYSHGGILDINESEEIISDDGNDIELTDYNAAFDDPNDLSTGVKSLFQAKDGGRIGLYQGGGPHGGGADSGSKGGSKGGGGPPGGGDKGMYSGPSTSTGGDTSRTRIQDEKKEDLRQKQMRDIIATGPGSDEEKYDSWEQMVQDKYTGQGLTTKQPHFNIQKSKVILNKAREDWNAVKDKFNDKYKKKVGKKIIGGLLGMGVTFGISDIIGMMIDGYKTNKAKQEFISDIKTQIKNYTDLGLPTHSPHTDTLIQTLNQEILDLTQKRGEDDDTGGDGPTLPPQLGGPSTEEMATEYGMSALDRIRAGQAKYAAYIEKIEREKLAREDNPIVGGTERNIIAIGNSGGLANLFRVKNQ